MYQHFAIRPHCSHSRSSRKNTILSLCRKNGSKNKGNRERKQWALRLIQSTYTYFLLHHFFFLCHFAFHFVRLREMRWLETIWKYSLENIWVNCIRRPMCFMCCLGCSTFSIIRVIHVVSFLRICFALLYGVWSRELE